ncbi:acyl carrier protein [Xanthomonas translucens]|uniref:acyl carrier protein n=1 Tax=Xanthomonas campestris pv. translucens TaxID=343 RepID=UPI0002A78B1A|nr:acyl carrier protein [Xanthomonas translucens]AKK67637.1 phosphopantetheine-binding protein [Xanthomonas translucens pv. undulosa]AVY66587.1 phosphopantetheine-binding protein [Xanthomonas translucens pv. undulosa]ELP96975.1 acyl carrier protein [Xanthomonas translucens DAR61454]MBC3972760.1 acyl carrier protein [Xanthomonas translucens pv. undulosa]MCT8271972.1 acyl carrier protein [Xanthomonas translucens pv. undulosa]
MTTSIETQIHSIVARHGEIDPAGLSADTKLQDLGVDSLEAIEILFDIEEHFDITFPQRDPNLDDGSLGKLAEAVQQALDAKAAAAAPAPAH